MRELIEGAADARDEVRESLLEELDWGMAVDVHRCKLLRATVGFLNE